MRILVDTGLLMAYLSRRDAHHRWAKRWFNHAVPPLLTCEAVLTEACFLLKRDRQDPSGVLDLVQVGSIRVAFDLGANAARIAALMRRYADRPMSLADACLVLMSEGNMDAPLLTTDETDFSIYRRADGSPVPALFPSQLPA